MVKEKEIKMLPRSLENIWLKINNEANAIMQKETHLNEFLTTNILNHNSLASCLSHLISFKLKSEHIKYNTLRDITDFAYSKNDELARSALEDILATFERDAACTRFINPVLYFKGFQALQCHRIANYYYYEGNFDLAYFMQMMISNRFSVDIHPAAKVGCGILIDHANGIVIGETAVVGNNVSLLHSVTLGGTGKEEGDRHPKIGNGVLIGAGAKVLGNIRVGECSKIASGSVVLNDVPMRKTVAGVPAKIVGEVSKDIDPSRVMDHKLESYNLE